MNGSHWNLGNNVLHDGLVAGIDARAAVGGARAGHCGGWLGAEDDILKHVAKFGEFRLDAVASVELKVGGAAVVAAHAVEGCIFERVHFLNQHAKREVLVRAHEFTLSFRGGVGGAVALFDDAVHSVSHYDFTDFLYALAANGRCVQLVLNRHVELDAEELAGVSGRHACDVIGARWGNGGDGLRMGEVYSARGDGAAAALLLEICANVAGHGLLHDPALNSD